MDTNQEIQNDSNDELKLRVMKSENVFVDVEISKTASVKDLKEKVASLAAQNQQMQDIRPDNQRLVYQGHILTPDTKILSTIPRLESGKTIIVTTVDPSQANPTNNQAPSQDSLQQRANNTRAMNRLTNCRLLQKNFDECIRQAQLDLEPSSRVRHNTLETHTPEAPKLTDLGYLTRDMTNSLLVWSSQLERLGKLLVEDRRLPDRECEDYGYHRRLIQNNMDAARYLSPQLRNYADFIIPLAEERPRRLGVITPRPDTTGRPNN